MYTIHLYVPRHNAAAVCVWKIRFDWQGNEVRSVHVYRISSIKKTQVLFHI